MAPGKKAVSYMTPEGASAFLLFVIAVRPRWLSRRRSVEMMCCGMSRVGIHGWAAKDVCLPLYNGRDNVICRRVLSEYWDCNVRVSLEDYSQSIIQQYTFPFELQFVFNLFNQIFLTLSIKISYLYKTNRKRMSSQWTHVLNSSWSRVRQSSVTRPVWRHYVQASPRWY